MQLCESFTAISASLLFATAVAPARAAEPAAPPATTAATATVTADAAPPDAAPKIRNPELFLKSTEAAHRALQHYRAYDNDVERRRVAAIGYRVAQQSGFTDFPFTFYLIEMPEPNALALPGGQIFITRGMLNLGLDDDMLASLLGHEIGHVVKQHGIKMERRAMLLNILSQAALVGVIVGADRDSGRNDPVPDYDRLGRVYRDTGDGNLVAGTYAAGIILTELLLRSYGREFEDEADEEGQRWAAAAGFDPQGAQKLMAVMAARIPESKEYGYWRTHPFLTERVAAGKARSPGLRRMEAKTADGFRRATQETLLSYLESRKAEIAELAVKEERERRERAGDRPRDPRGPIGDGTERAGDDGRPPRGGGGVRGLLERSALLAWPQGERADALRLAHLHVERDAALERPALSRDYGAVILRYREEIAEVSAMTPDSPTLAILRDELGTLETAVRELYPQAAATLREGIYETTFLESFLSNYPDAAERPLAAIALGDAYSRLGKQAAAVDHYLETWRAAPASAEGERAQAGLRNLAPYLEQLAALEQLSQQEQDAELRRLAGERLCEQAGTFTKLENGAEYLRLYPEGSEVERVAERLNLLAQQLYSEIVLYQSVGDHLKAIQRIQDILTHAPTSPAADRLRERAVIASG